MTTSGEAGSRVQSIDRALMLVELIADSGGSLRLADLEAATGEAITIAERSSDEVAIINDVRIIPDSVTASYPAFDVTPAELVTAIITEEGVARPPYTESLAALCAAAAAKS